MARNISPLEATLTAYSARLDLFFTCWLVVFDSGLDAKQVGVASETRPWSLLVVCDCGAHPSSWKSEKMKGKVVLTCPCGRQRTVLKPAVVESYGHGSLCVLPFPPGIA